MAVEIPTAPREKGKKQVVENLLLLTEKKTKNYKKNTKKVKVSSKWNYDKISNFYQQLVF